MKKKVKLRKNRILLALLITLLIVSLVLMFVVVSSSKKHNKLNCKANNEYKTEFNFKFKKNNLIKVDYYQSKTLTKTELENINLYYSYFLETYSAYENNENIKMDTDKDETGYYIKLSFDLDKYTENNKLFNRTLNYDETKKYYEGQGYTCK